MAHYGKETEEFAAQRTVNIIGIEHNDNFTVYVIEVTLGPYSWTVKHRYSEFHDLHEKLISVYPLDKHLLPRKKLFGNQNEAFVKKRQRDLQTYLRNILSFFTAHIPDHLCVFLHFHKYEIHGITQTLAEELYHKGDALLQSRHVFHVTPLQLHALTERLKLPEPTCDSGDVKKDIGHILDFITRVWSLRINGTNAHVETSNINMNELKFDLTLFKSIRHLQIVSCNVAMIQGITSIKDTSEILEVHHCLENIKDILCQEAPYWRSDENTALVTYWLKLTHADFSYNGLKNIDESAQLMPKVEILNLSHNQIASITHLQYLSELTELNLSYNNIVRLDALHTKLGNLQTLNLSGNKLESMQAFTKLFSLKVLNLSNNEISQFLEVKNVSNLPCIEYLMLSGNPVVIVPDYRTKVLELFGERVTEIVLDNISTSQQEMDTVAVLQAIQKAKDLKERQLLISKPHQEVPIVNTETLNPDSQPIGNHDTPKDHNFVPRTRQAIIRPITAFSGNIATFDHTPMSTTDHTHTSTTDYSTDIPAPGNNERLPSSNNSNHIKDSSNIQLLDALDGCGSSAQKLTVDTGSPGDTSDQSNVNISPKYQSSGLSPDYLDVVSSSPVDMSGSDTVSFTGSESRSDYSSSIIVPDDLPSLIDGKYSSSLTRRLLLLEYQETVQSGLPNSDTIVASLWCYAERQSDPMGGFLACLTLTNRHFYIQRVKQLQRDSSNVLPVLETFYIIPVFNLSSITIGCNRYLRLQEAFVGPEGTFLIKGIDPSCTVEFIGHVKLKFRSPQKKRELNNESQVNLLDFSDVYLETLLTCVRKYDSLGSEVDIKLICDVHFMGMFAHLLLTTDHLYIFKNNMANDISCRLTSEDFEKNFELLRIHSIFSKISNMTTDKLSDIYKIKSSYGLVENMPNIVNKSLVTEFYVASMKINHMDGSQDTLDVWFLTLKERDEFLIKFIETRSNIVSILSCEGRQEPEGGNEKSSQEIRNSVSPPSKVHFSSNNDSNNLDQSSSSHHDEYGLDKTPQTPKLIPPVSLDLKLDINESSQSTYPSSFLINHIATCLSNVYLLQKLTSKLKALSEMPAPSFIDYFHKNFQLIGQFNEEMYHLTWAPVIPYTNPNQELLTCVIITSRAVYLISEDTVQCTSRPKWMMHVRNRSEFSLVGLPCHQCDCHNSSGIVLGQTSNKTNLLRPYVVMLMKEIRCLNIGISEQYIRVVGTDARNVFTIVTRDAVATRNLQQHFAQALSLITITTPDTLERSGEYDFYSNFNQVAGRTVDLDVSGLPSSRKNVFKSQNDELIADWLFVIRQTLKNIPSQVSLHIQLYILVYYSNAVTDSDVFSKSVPRTVLLINNYICLAREDLVSFPPPEFARGLPDTKRLDIIDIRNVRFVQFVTIRTNLVNLILSDESDDIEVDISLEHFGQSRSVGRSKAQTSPEISWSFYIQQRDDLNKFIDILSSVYRELNESVLSVKYIDH